VEEDSKVIITVGVHYAFVYQHDGELFGVEAEYAEWLGEEGGDKMEVVMSAEAHEHLAETISGELAGAKAVEEKFEGELRKRFCLPCAPPAPQEDTPNELTTLRKAIEEERFSVRVGTATTEELKQGIIRDYSQAGAVLITKLHSSPADKMDSIAQIFRARKVLQPLLAATQGKVVKSATTRTFVFYRSAEQAVVSALVCIEALRRYNEQVAAGLRLSMSFGVHNGEVLLFPGDLYGDAVNVSSKLAEDLAIADEFLISDSVKELVA
jgi:hypothetical protein